MKTWHDRRAAACLAVGVCALAATVATEVRAQAPAVDPAATKILQRMTDYLGSLKQFSVRTQNTLEDLLASGHRVDFDVSANVIVQPAEQAARRAQGRSARPDVLLRWQDADAVQPVGQGVCDRACTRHDRGGPRLRARVARAYRPGRRPGLPQRLPAADAGCDLGGGGRQGRHRWGQVRSSGLQPPGGGLSGLGRRRRPAVAVQVCRHRHGHPRPAERHHGHERLERRSGRGRQPGSPSCRPRGSSGSRSCHSQPAAAPAADTNRRTPMHTLRRIAAVAMALVVMLMADVPLLPVSLVPEAQAILGTRRRTAVVVGATVHAADSAQMAQAQQQTAAAQQQATAPAAGRRRRAGGCRRQAGGCRCEAAGCCSASPAVSRRRETVAAGHCGCRPPPGLRRHTGRRRGVLLLRRELLPRGVSGEPAGVCDDEAEMTQTAGTSGHWGRGPGCWCDARSRGGGAGRGRCAREPRRARKQSRGALNKLMLLSAWGWTSTPPTHVPVTPGLPLQGRV